MAHAPDFQRPTIANAASVRGVTVWRGHSSVQVERLKLPANPGVQKYGNMRLNSSSGRGVSVLPVHYPELCPRWLQPGWNTSHDLLSVTRHCLETAYNYQAVECADMLSYNRSGTDECAAGDEGPERASTLTTAGSAQRTPSLLVTARTTSRCFADTHQQGCCPSPSCTGDLVVTQRSLSGTSWLAPASEKT